MDRDNTYYMQLGDGDQKRRPPKIECATASVQYICISRPTKLVTGSKTASGATWSGTIGLVYVIYAAPVAEEGTNHAGIR
jgi:hypothetical protein